MDAVHQILHMIRCMIAFELSAGYGLCMCPVFICIFFVETALVKTMQKNAEYQKE